MTDRMQMLRNYTYIAGAGAGVATIFSSVAYWQRALEIAVITDFNPKRTTYKAALNYATDHQEMTGMKSCLAGLKRWHGLLKLGTAVMLIAGALTACFYQKTKAFEAHLKPSQ